MQASKRGNKRRRPWLRILAAQAVLLGLLLVGMEFGYRRLTSAGREHSAQGARELFERTRASIHSDLPMLPSEREGEVTAATHLMHPFTGYDKLMAFELVAEEVERQARGEWDAGYEVMIVGGSVSKILCDVGGGEIERLVSADPRLAGRAVRVICLGSGGFKQPQQVALAAWLFSLGLVPDVLVNIDGFNEVALSMANARGYGVHPLFPSFEHWGKFIDAAPLAVENVRVASAIIERRERIQSLCGLALKLRLYRSSLGTKLVREALQAQQASIGELQEGLKQRLASDRREILTGPPMPHNRIEGQIVGPDGGQLDPDIATRLGFALKIALEGWSRSSRSLAGLCAAHGVHYLHVLQPTLHDPGAKPVTAEELRVGTAGPSNLIGVLNGYPRLRAGGELLAAEGIAFHDASRLYADEERTIYVDACHVNALGNEALARDVALALLASLP